MDYRALFIVPIAALVLSVSAATPRMPDDWHLVAIAHSENAPSNPGYQADVDPATTAIGTPTLHLRSIGTFRDRPQSIGAVTHSAGGYGGRRVRFTAEVRVEGASTWSGAVLFPNEGMHLVSVAQGDPGVEAQLPLGQAVRADQGWQQVQLVLDVPAGTPIVSLGFAVVGTGELWARRLRFEEVGPGVPTTTSTVGLDWARARTDMAETRRAVARLPAQALANAELN